MTPAPHNPEKDLEQTLARHAERLAHQGSPLELDQVLGRAGEIRRGRRMRATMAMAAVVLAVAVPVGITTLNAPTDDRPDFANTPSAIPTPDDTRPVGLGEYRSGGAPSTGYVQDGTLYYNGTERSVGSNVNYLERLNGGFLIGQYDGGGNVTVRFLADAGDSPDTTWTLAGGIAVSPSGSNGAFVETNGTVILVQDGGATVLEIGTLPTGSDYSYEAVAVSDGNCAPSSDTSCSVWAVTTGPKQTAWEIPTDGSPKKVPSLDGLVAVDQFNNVVRRIAVDDSTGGTYALYDLDGRRIWTTSEFTPRAFSPDGKYLIADPAYVDGNTQQITILDSATGRPVTNLKTATSSLPGGVVSVFETVWEDDTHVLSTVTEGDQYAVVRVDLNGNREYAVPTRGGADPYSLSIRLG
ncbi:MAG: hypothetical protein NTV23_16105 [Propionibacteriales bacterium]|nr:hypothetical protein [Propionibacteriales bacterium]